MIEGHGLTASFQLEDVLAHSVDNSRSRANSSMESAENEIRRMRRLNEDMDKLEEDFEKIKHIRDKVKAAKEKVDRLSDKLDRSRPSGHGPAGARRR
jgi:protein-arginine kinase activator protein McsA